MALSKNVLVDSVGVTIPAYIRINKLIPSYEKHGACMPIELNWYGSKELCDANENPFIWSDTYHCPAKIEEKDEEGNSTGILIDNPDYVQFFSDNALQLNEANPRKNAYLFLKSLDKFSDSIDC